MRRIGMIIIAIALIGIAVGVVFVLANPLTSTHQLPSIGVIYIKLTLPMGSSVPFNQQEGNAYPEYTFRYGGPLGDQPDLLEVWAGNSTLPQHLSVTLGTAQTVYEIEVTITQVHPDHIVIKIKQLT